MSQCGYFRAAALLLDGVEGFMGARFIRVIEVIILAVLASGAAAQRFDPHPWLADLAEAKEAFETKYANLEWAQLEVDPPLAQLISQTEERVKAAGSEAEARSAFDWLARRLGDGHVQFDWPQRKRSTAANAAAVTIDSICSDYDASHAAPPLAAEITGYQPLQTAQSAIFPAGVIARGSSRLGVIKIGLFGPHASPQYCRAAVAALQIPQNKPCDDPCQDRIDHWASVRMTQDFKNQIEALKAAGADVLLVDIAANGGGSEWAEAAARMITPVRLVSEPVGFVRGAHWVKRLGTLETRLREAARSASTADRTELVRLADRAAAAKAVAATPCNSAPLWAGRRLACSWLGGGIFATGLISSADPAALRGKTWSSLAFAPIEVPYQEAIWSGPLAILVDKNTASAAEEFAAELQDNRAALIVGEPTYGAGCGHTDGGTPTRLSHSGAVLELPDCARFRSDGTNEVRGVVPDVLVGFRKSDSTRLKAAALAAKLPELLEGLRKFHASETTSFPCASPDSMSRWASAICSRPNTRAGFAL
jgi:hypothetical protein